VRTRVARAKPWFVVKDMVLVESCTLVFELETGISPFSNVARHIGQRAHSGPLGGTQRGAVGYTRVLEPIVLSTVKRRRRRLTVCRR